MKICKSVLALAVASLVSGAAQSDVLWTGDFNSSNGGLVNDGVRSGINGMDMLSDGSAAFFKGGVQLNPSSTGSVVTGDVVRTYYQGVVNAYRTATSSQLNSTTNPTGTYQITVAAYFDEVVTLAVPGFALLQPIAGSGRVGLFYDEVGLAGGGTFINTTAGILAGVGYTDGILLASGVIGTTLPNAFVSDGTSGSGSATINGPLSFVKLGFDDVADLLDDVGFLAPVPDGFISTTTLQFGSAAAGTDFQTVNFFDDANGFASQAAEAGLTVRADANVDFSVVPEPASLFLMGLGLLGLGLNRRGRAGLDSAAN